MKSMNRQFHYTPVIAVLVLVAVSTTQLSSVVPSDDNVVYASSTNSQAQSHNDECEYNDSSGKYDGSNPIIIGDCVFDRPVYIGNTTAVTRPPSEMSALQGAPGSLGNDSSQTIVIPHDEYKTKMQQVIKNALKD
jgi:hypothetical protein